MIIKENLVKDTEYKCDNRIFKFVGFDKQKIDQLLKI